MKKTKQIISIVGIICILLTLSLADVDDWNSYDSYDYSWDDDYRYSSNNDDYKSTPKITDESYEYDETWNEATVIPVEGYPDINYSNTTPNYYLYYMRNYKLPEGGGLVPKNGIEKTIRIKKTALSYDYDIIYDKEDGNHTINNPLNKEIKSEEFSLTPDYEKILHEEFCPRNSSIEEADSYKLNDYFYYKNLDENGKEIIYKVYKDLIKIDSKNHMGSLLIEDNYTYFTSSDEIGEEGSNKYYIDNKTGEIKLVNSEKTMIIPKELEWGFFVTIILMIVLGVPLFIIFPSILLIIIVKLGIKGLTNAEIRVRKHTEKLSGIDKLEESDFNFNKNEFLQWVESVFMELQTAWTNKDLDKLKTLEDNALYATHKAQLERYIKDKKTNYIERIAIREKEINGYKEEDGFEFIDLTLKVEMVDYIKDDVTGKVIKGRAEKRLMMEYNIVFKRKKGVKTDTVGELETVNCPSCGAPIDISASAVCEYCNNVINTSNHSWVMSQYKGQNVYR